MPIRLEKTITREMVRSNRETIYCFGDNMERRGFGGQAKAMRGEPNAVGIPTKWKPTMEDDAFFMDCDLPVLIAAISKDVAKIERQLKQGQVVVWPEAGIGTGLSQLTTRAPAIHAHLERILRVFKAYDDLGVCRIHIVPDLTSPEFERRLSEA